MRLRVVTPLAVAVDEDGVTAVRAEDESGSFGILRGHADFLTRLAVSVVSWTGADGARRHCAVRSGLLTVSKGTEVAVATREAVVGTDLDSLHREVVARFEHDLDAERAERVESTRLHLAAIRRIVEQLKRGGIAEAP
ncbi:MAG: F0F1 ATP synthase subunit epsilon [Amaricoccus sp.]